MSQWTHSSKNKLCEPSQPYKIFCKINYFGHKLHIDQNEKLVSIGVTHIVAWDGYSGKIVGFLTLPVKNNVVIYDGVYRSVCCMYIPPVLYYYTYMQHEIIIQSNDLGCTSSLSSVIIIIIQAHIFHLYRSVIEQYGLFDQLRIDHGREFYLIMFIQEQVRATFGSRAVTPYIQSTSKEVK